MTQKTMTPEEFEKWLKKERGPHPYISLEYIISQFRTVKWEKTCEGCGWDNMNSPHSPCYDCMRNMADHYTPRNEGKEIKP